MNSENFQFILKYPNGDINIVEKNKVIEELYFKLAVLPKYQDIKSIFKIKNVKKYLINLPKQISLLEEYIPLFDINSKNIYIIAPNNLYYRVIDQNYRLPNNKTIPFLEETITFYKKIKNPSSIILKYIETLTKNINFLRCYDLNLLEETFYKLFYKSSPITDNITTCIRPSYIPFLNKKKPYFSKQELKMHALNMDFNIESENIDVICNIVKKNDINAETLIKHLLYISENDAKDFIRSYTFLGSYFINNYLRKHSIKDPVLEYTINKLWSFLNMAPSFDKEYYVYRFVNNDDYLNHLRVGDIYTDNSFISTTRNPFYNMDNNLFGYVLLKIKIPAKKNGIALCLESYSLFPEEEELILSPGKLKLIGINDDINYYHHNPIAENKIKKKYEFEYLEPLFNSPISKLTYFDNDINIPFIDFSSLIIKGKTIENKLSYFSNMIPKSNDIQYFYAKIGSIKYLFQLVSLNTDPIYKKYFYLDTSSDINGLCLIIQDEITSTIKLLIEIKDIISVNYIFKYIGTSYYFNDNDILQFLAYLGKSFNINTIYYHDDYISYSNITKDYLQDIKITEIEFQNPDTHIMNLLSGYFTYYPKEIITFIESLQRNEDFIPKFYGQPGIIYNLSYDFIKNFVSTPIDNILESTDYAPLYRLHVKNPSFKLLLDFYLFIHYNYFYLLEELNIKISRYLIKKGIEKNPWTSNFIKINPNEYLFEKGLIKYIDTNITKKYY